jgi:uncharacterized protein YndB with AHSA1/START domain
MEKPIVAHVTTAIDAPIDKVWDALVNPATIKQYMFGTDVISDWKEGGPILWKGEWQGKSFEDRGVIVRIEPKRLLQYTHFSPLAGLPDTPDNYHTVTIELSQVPPQTHVSLSQDNNPTDESREHSEKNWRAMLVALKKLLEKESATSAR